jgi:uncharacterized protein YjbI with pentapeptide repeats
MQGRDLMDAQLAYVDLTGADLYWGSLQGCVLQGAILRDCCLRGAWLVKANLREADLTHANLSLDNLGGTTHLEDADLTGGDPRGCGPARRMGAIDLSERTSHAFRRRT